MTIVEAISRMRSPAFKTAVRTARLGRSLWSVLSFSLADNRIAPGRSLSVVLETGRISVVYASRFLSRIKIRGIRCYPFEEGKVPTPENLASAVALAINGLRIPRTQVTLVIPKAWAIMKTAEFPLTVKDNLSAVISYELDRLTPLSADRAFYDFRIIGEDKSRLKIMLAAMNSDILQPYLTALKEREIRIRRVTISTFAFAALGHYVNRSGSTIFIASHAGGYEGGLVRDGRLQISLAENFSSGDEQSRESMIAAAINPLIDMIKKEGQSPHVMVDHPLSEPRYSRLRDVIHAPVRFIREIDLGIECLNNVNPKEVSHMALGGALECLWTGTSKMNLLDRGIHESSRTPMALSIGILSILILLGVFWILSPLQIEEQRLEAIDREISIRKDEVKKVEALKKDVENIEKEIFTIRSFKTSRPMVMILLKELTRSLPKNAWLSRVRIAESIVEIEGYAASATELLPKLEASEYFKKVDFASPTIRDTRMKADRFAIKMEIEGLPEEKAGNGKQK
ncbi:MAG: PilN domain-containing protein [Syntrophales bacterium]|jgi:Tfp pilus assembly protein PilN|nr:PilN domain-containing protein [Syntrophales bacterium]MCK9392836.1 PilN domain-containing protein [Syntrophales bacterium]